MRCAEAGGWTVFVPVNVKVFAPVPIVSRPLTTGSIVTADDYQLEERDLTRLGPGVVTDPALINGRLSSRMLTPGQIFYSSALRAVPVIDNGDSVQVHMKGDGFEISSSGIALSQAEEGQNVRVKLDNGRVIQGAAHTGKTVEVNL